jgi:hypothetical protein
VIGAVVVIAPALPWPGVVTAIEVVVSTTVVFALIWGIRLNRPVHRAGWYVLLGSIAYPVVSNVAWPVLQAAGLMGHAPSVDLLSFTTYPVLGPALLILPLQGRKIPWSAGLTEAGIITSGLAVVWWVLLIRSRRPRPRPCRPSRRSAPPTSEGAAPVEVGCRSVTPLRSGTARP